MALLGSLAFTVGAASLFTHQNFNVIVGLITTGEPVPAVDWSVGPRLRVIADRAMWCSIALFAGTFALLVVVLLRLTRSSQPASAPPAAPAASKTRVAGSGWGADPSRGSSFGSG